MGGKMAHKWKNSQKTGKEWLKMHLFSFLGHFDPLYNFFLV
jgi:hypothetical protein